MEVSFLACFFAKQTGNIKVALDRVEEDLLGECSITCEDYEDYLHYERTTLDFTQRIRDEIKKHNFPENIRERIEIIEACLKIFEEYMEQRLGLDISKGYPMMDNFFSRGRKKLYLY